MKPLRSRGASVGQPPIGPRTIAPQWAWHYRTLLALRDHLSGGAGDRLREPGDAMEPPSLHAGDFAGELFDRDLAQALPENRAEALREIDDAIQRLETGAFGRCERTGRPLPKSALRKTPWLRLLPAATPRQHQGVARKGLVRRDTPS